MITFYYNLAFTQVWEIFDLFSYFFDLMLVKWALIMINSFLVYNILIIFVEPCFRHMLLSVKIEHQFMTRTEAKNEYC